ncbi:MAG: hypothetical protein DRZ80_02830 [Thermoprotei archaeon]|nr:MAG: hypothetical protein DRZ80_02830 [Thermoprotei archaeon]
MVKNLRVLIFLPVLVYVFAFYYFPLTMIIRDAFIDSGGFTLEYFISLFYDESVIFSIAFSFWQAFISVILSLLMGIPVAYILTKYDFPGKNILLAIIMVPFILPGVVVGYAILSLYGVNGYITALIARLLGVRIVLGQGLPGIFISHTFYNASLVALITSSVWRRLDPEIEEAAEVLGSKGFHKFIRVTLPMIAPGILSASLLVFIFCFTSFEIILILGGAVYRTIEVEIYSLYLAFFDFNRAAALSILQLIFIAIVTFFYLKTVENVAEIRRVGRTAIYPTKPLITNLKDLLSPRKLFIIIFLIFFAFFMIAPLLVIFISAFYDPVTKRFTLRGIFSLFSTEYNTFLGAEPILAPINSIFYSMLTTLIVFLISLASVRVLYGRRTLSILYGLLIFLPVATSRITIGLGMIAAYGPLGALSIDPRPYIIAAHTLIAYPFAVRSMLNGLSKMDPDVLDASDTLGATGLKKFLKVELPLLKPSLATAIALSFAISIGEFAATNLLYRGRYATLTVFLFLMIGGRKFIAAGAAAMLLCLISLIAFLVIVKFGEDISASL